MDERRRTRAGTEPPGAYGQHRGQRFHHGPGRAVRWREIQRPGPRARSRRAGCIPEPEVGVPAVSTDELITTIDDIVAGITARWGRDYYMDCARKNEPPT